MSAIEQNTTNSDVAFTLYVNTASMDNSQQQYAPTHTEYKPRVRPRSHYEQELWNAGIDTRGMDTYAMKGFCAARDVVLRSIVCEPIVFDSPNTYSSVNEERYYAALAIGVRHFLQAHEYATGAE
jgi:hypothetical protein